jgi:DNA ligase-1
MNQPIHTTHEATTDRGFARFARLVWQLGNSTKTNEKLQLLSSYFATAPDADKVWTIAIFSGRRPKRIVNTRQLQDWAVQLAGIPTWLFEECYHTVGDLAETIALVLPSVPENISYEHTSLTTVVETFVSLANEDEVAKRAFIEAQWLHMPASVCFVFNKLITGGFRIGISQKMMVNALAKATSLEASLIAHLISGNWNPANTSFSSLLSRQASAADPSKPYPFYLAYQLDVPLEQLGQTHEWQAEWKWDGIRGQLIVRSGQLFVWSRGEELLTDKFPEYHPLAQLLPHGTALDGEIVGLHTNTQANANVLKPAPFAHLQTRIGRKTITKKQLKEAPVGFIAYDLLEYDGQDWRSRPLWQRRAQLEQIINQLNQLHITCSPLVPFAQWPDLTVVRSQSRTYGSEGLMLKRKESAYLAGRKVGNWWKWKIDPLVIDAVLIYAQKGHGRRSNLYTDYTFAVRDGDRLVTFTKAYSGLTDAEFAEVDTFVKRNSLERFGPVRTVKPELVFEIAFEGIAASSRHKSGISLRFPRINRWRKDKKADEINTLDDLKQLLEMYGQAP